MSWANTFASVNLADDDAGSGQITNGSPQLGPMTVALHNITSRNLHDISTGLPDERQFLRNWRRQLNDCLQLQSARMVRFLLSDPTGDLADAPLIKRCNELLSKYSKPTWSFTSSMRDISMNTSTVESLTEIEQELGVSALDFGRTYRKAIRMYVDAVTALCVAEGRLEEKLKRIETVVNRVNDLMFLEPTMALEQMGDAAQSYLVSVLDKISLEEDYNAIMTQYKRFCALRPIVLLGNFQKAPTPTCSICMTKELTHVVTPCGHTYCEDCCKSQLTACYICRIQIRDRVKMYFS
jgi:hypothetical protein